MHMRSCPNCGCTDVKTRKWFPTWGSGEVYMGYCPRCGFKGEWESCDEIAVIRFWCRPLLQQCHSGKYGWLKDSGK